jgi:hypothetical protein
MKNPPDYRSPGRSSKAGLPRTWASASQATSSRASATPLRRQKPRGNPRGNPGEGGKGMTFALQFSKGKLLWYMIHKFICRIVYIIIYIYCSCEQPFHQHTISPHIWTRWRYMNMSLQYSVSTLLPRSANFGLSWLKALYFLRIQTYILSNLKMKPIKNIPWLRTYEKIIGFFSHIVSP